MNQKFIPYKDYIEYPIDEMIKRSAEFFTDIKRRRSIRKFSERTVPADVITNCIKAAGAAPSGANLQPWHFVIVSNNEVKRKIREAAEREEYLFYSKRAPDEWLEALTPLGTGEKKPFLEKAPYLIAIFSKSYDIDENGKKSKNYYAQESTGIAAGFLIAALHNAGLASLTHTPSPMNFLNKILNRPSNERPFLLLVTGYPAEDAHVPRIEKKSLEDIATYI